MRASPSLEVLVFRRFWLPLFMVTALAAVQGQVSTVQLRIQVFSAETKRPLTETVSVELMDGGGVVESEQRTNEQSVANFLTGRGSHRLRVTSIEYEEYQASFEIYYESAHTETVYLKPKPPVGGSPASPVGKKGTVSAARLKIPSAAQKEYEHGVAAMEKKDFLKARQHFEKAVLLYPDYDLAYNSLGILAIERNDTEAARKAFATAIKINDHYAQAHRNLARILISERKFPEVEDLLGKSLSIEPMNAWALTQIAYAELQDKKFAEAVENARRAHTLPHEGLAEAHMIAAAALESLHQELAAAAEYQLYLKEAPTGAYAQQAREALTRLQAAVPQP